MKTAIAVLVAACVLSTAANAQFAPWGGFATDGLQNWKCRDTGIGKTECRRDGFPFPDSPQPKAKPVPSKKKAAPKKS